MLHPSYSDLMKVVNADVEPGEEPVVSSRYSIVMATSKRARQILYLDSIVAVSKIPYLQDLFNRIVARGKCKMCARCACMRKLLLIMRAFVVQEKPFDNKILEIYFCKSCSTACIYSGEYIW